jgi:hypothetical protein
VPAAHLRFTRLRSLLLLLLIPTAVGFAAEGGAQDASRLRKAQLALREQFDEQSVRQTPGTRIARDGRHASKAKSLQ